MTERCGWLCLLLLSAALAMPELAGYVDWPWWVVAGPLLMPFALALGAVVLWASVVAAFTIVNRVSRLKLARRAVRKGMREQLAVGR